jgi:enoyl-CoA hydratase/carnithine racemase
MLSRLLRIAISATATTGNDGDSFNKGFDINEILTSEYDSGDILEHEDQVEDFADYLLSVTD